VKQRQNKAEIIYSKQQNGPFSGSWCTCWNTCWPGIRSGTFSVYINTFKKSWSDM